MTTKRIVTLIATASLVALLSACADQPLRDASADSYCSGGSAGTPGGAHFSNKPLLNGECAPGEKNYRTGDREAANAEFAQGAAKRAEAAAIFDLHNPKKPWEKT